MFEREKLKPWLRYLCISFHLLVANRSEVIKVSVTLLSFHFLYLETLAIGRNCHCCNNIVRKVNRMGCILSGLMFMFYFFRCGDNVSYLHTGPCLFPSCPVLSIRFEVGG